MECKFNYWTILLSVILIFEPVFSYELPRPTILLLKPVGFQVSIPDEPGIQFFAFHANINRVITVNDPGEIQGTVFRSKNGLWTFKDSRIMLRENDVINYWIYAQVNGKSHQRTDLSYTVRSNGDKNNDDQSTTVAPTTSSSSRQIFEENFESLDSSRWLREIKIPLSPDYEFCVLHNDNHPDLTTIKDGILHIKPLILDDSYGENATIFGNLILADCTSSIPQECSREARSWNILPPVISARLTTRQSFSFKYGKIEIRAKFPEGDWLYPDLWLVPRYSTYGSDYRSGRVILGLSRGNSNLVSASDSSKIWDSRKIEFGLRVGPLENIREYFVSRLQQNGPRWTEGFHVYTTIWNENGFSFLIDGYELGQIHPGEEGWLQSDTMTSTEKNAPFDQEFSITIGVGVGGVRVFPDDTSNSGNMKPWKNVGAKAMLNFLNAKSQWLPTWRRNRGKNSALQIDYIRVWSL